MPCAGLYTCQVNNGFGPPVRQRIRLRWREALRVSPLTSSANYTAEDTLHFNSSLQLNCSLESGFPLPVEVTWWRRGNELIRSSADGRVQTNGNSLTINRLLPEDSAKYSCALRNQYEFVHSPLFPVRVASRKLPR